MNKAVPWSIKGVDFDARTAAKEAARRSGMTLGEWLNSVIAEQAAEQGIDPDDIGEDGRIDAVRSRLERMSSSRRRGDRAPRARMSEDDYDLEDDYVRRGPRRVRPHTAAREVSWGRDRYEDGAEGFLDEAVRSFERRARRDSAETSAALDHVARRLESLEGRIGGSRAEPESDRTLKRVISRLESRIEALAAHADADEQVPAASARPFPAAMTRPSAPNAGGMRSSELARIEAKLNRLLERETLPAARYAGHASESRGGMAEAIAEINRRQADLDRPYANQESAAPVRAPRISDPGPASPARAPGREALREALGDHQSEIRSTVSTLKTEIADLSRHIDGLRRESAQPELIVRRVREAIPAAPDPTPAIEGLRRQIMDMGETISRLAPRESVSSLEAALRDLGEQVRQTRRVGVGEQVLEPVERLIGDLKATMREFAPQSAVATIERELQAINRNIEGIGRSPVDPEQFERVCAQTEEIRNLLAAAVARPAPLENVEKQISALARRVDLIASRGLTPVGVSAVNQSVGEIRDAMAQANLAPFMMALEERVEELSRKIDEAATRPAAANPKLDEIAQRLDAMHKSMSSQGPAASSSAVQPEHLDVIAKRLDVMQQTINWQAERAPAATVDTSSLEGMLEQIMERLSKPQPPVVTPVPELDGLERTLRDLAQRVDAMSRQPEKDTLLHLEDRLGEISARLDRAATSDLPLGDLERTLGQLASQLEESRLNAMDAASNAARYAAQDVLEEFRRSQASGEPASLDYARELIAKEIGALRSVQDASDRRTHATLGAVHETLEKVVDRLAMLEEEITDRDSTVPSRSSPAVESRSEAEAQRPAPEAKPLVRSAVGGDEQQEGEILTSGPAPVFSRPSAAVPSVQSPASAAQPAAPAVSAPVPPQRPAADLAPTLPALRPAPPVHAGASALDNVLLEPGSGKRPGRTQQDDVGETIARDDRGSSSSFIAAARRAQQAAQAQAERQAAEAIQPGKGKAAKGDGGPLADARSRAKAAASLLSLRKSKSDQGEDAGQAAPGATAEQPKRGLFKNRKVLFSIAGLVLVLGALTILRQNMARTETPRSDAAISAPRTTASAAPARPAAAASAAASSLLAPNPSAPAPAGFSATPPASASLLTAQPAKPDGKPATAHLEGRTDPTPVASIPAFAGGLQPNGGTGLHSAAAGGNPQAQYELAVRLGEGRQETRDPVASAQWLQKAAQSGLAPAQYRLGSLYEKGIGVGKDLQQARHWYEQAASAGNVKAMHNFAVLLAEGGDGKPDYATAANWFKRAAEHGVRDSQYNLAILYARGLGVEQSLTEAYVWLALAEAQGDTDAGAKKNDVAKRLSAQQLAELTERVKRFRVQNAIAAANEVASPAGGWGGDAASPAAAAQPEPVRAPAKRPKVSSL